MTENENEDERDYSEMSIEEVEELYRAEMVKRIKHEDDFSQADLPLDPNSASGKLTEGMGNNLNVFYKGFQKRHGLEYVEYSENGLTGFAYTDADSSCPNDVSDWEPADVYAQLILQYQYCLGELTQVCVKGLEIEAGEGAKLQVKVLGQRSAQTGLGACECMTCVSNSWTTYETTCDRFGDYSVLCGKDIFSVGNTLKDSLIEAMGLSFKEAVDTEIYAQLVGATAGFSEDLSASLTCSEATSGTCCQYGPKIYKAIIDLEAAMREGGVRPDWLILAPSIAAFLKYKEGTSYPPFIGDIEMKGNRIVRIGNLKVIEYCGANTCTNAGDAIMGVMVDSRAAVCCIYGKPITFETKREPKCDSVDVVYNSYVAIDELSTSHIGFIRNP